MNILIPISCPCGQPGENLHCAMGGPGYSLKFAVECPKCGRRGPWNVTDEGGVVAWNKDQELRTKKGE